MIYAAPGASTELTFQGATGLVGTLGIRITEGSTDTEVLARQTTGINEHGATGVYTATVTTPDDAGQYTVIWDTGGASPQYASEDLTVTSSIAALLAPGEDLLTVAEVRLYTGTIGEDKPSDEWFEAAISGVSAQVQSYVGHKYRPYSGTEEIRVFSHDGTYKLNIDDCQDVSEVRVTGTPGDGVTWEDIEDDNWIAEPLESDVKNMLRFLAGQVFPAKNVGWSGLGLHIQEATQTQWPSEVRTVAQQFVAIEVTAKWGWEAVPANIELATQLWIQHLLSRDQAMYSPELAEAVIAQGTMPPDVKGILETEKGKHAAIRAI